MPRQHDANVQSPYGLLPVSIMLAGTSQPYYAHSSHTTLQEEATSILTQGVTERSKKRAALEHRENIKRELALRKKGYQKTAGKFIYRIDDLMMGHGWLLRIEMNEEFIYQMSFRDSEYGSPRIGLIEAQRKRDTLLKMHNIPYAEGRRFSKKIRATNSTGVPGVCRSGFHYHCYIPLLPNKRKTRKISITTYGEKLAFQMAVEWRREMETEVYGGTVLTDKEVEEIFKRK